MGKQKGKEKIGLVVDNNRAARSVQAIIEDKSLPRTSRLVELVQSPHKYDSTVGEFIKSFKLEQDLVYQDSEKLDSVVHVALKHGKLDYLRPLLDVGFDPALFNRDLKLPIHIILESTRLSLNDIERTCNVLLNPKQYEGRKLEDKDGSKVVAFMINVDRNLKIDRSDGNCSLHIAIEKGYVKIVEAMVDKGGDLNKLNEQRQSCIHLAAMHEDPKTSETLLHALRMAFFKGQSNVQPNLLGRDVHGLTPLHYATYYPKQASVELLLILGCDMEVRNKKGRTAIHLAAGVEKEGAFSILKYLLKKRDEKMKNEHSVDVWNRTALHYAALMGNEDCVEVLLKEGYSRWAVDYRKRTPLHLLCDTFTWTNNHIKTMEHLLKGSDVQKLNPSQGEETSTYANLPDMYGMTALHIAARTDNVEMAEKLLEYCASKYGRHQNLDLNALDGKQETALMKCIKKDPKLTGVNTVPASDKELTSPNLFRIPTSRSHLRKVEMTALLIRMGCNVDIQNEQNESAILILLGAKGWQDFNQLRGHVREDAEKMMYGVVKVLAKTGVNLVVKDGQGRGVIHVAAETGVKKIVNAIAGQVEDIDELDKNGETALFYAVRNNHLEACQVLVNDFDASVSVVNKQGMSPLHLACAEGHTSVASFLYNAGADPLLCNGDGWAPIIIAAKADNQGLFDEFLQHDGGLHPFRMIQVSKYEKLPLVLLMAQANVPRRSLEALVRRFTRAEERSVYGITTFYDYGISRSGYDYFLSGDGKTAVLDILRSNNNLVLSLDPIVAMTQELWDKYGFKRFMRVFLVYHVVLVCITLINFTIAMGWKGSFAVFIRTMLSLAAVFADVFMIFFSTVTAANAMRNNEIKAYLRSYWRIIEWAANIMVIVALPVMFNGDSQGAYNVLAVTLFLVWMRYLIFLGNIKRSSTIIRVVARMTATIAQFLILLFILILAFGMGFYLYFANKSNVIGYDTPGHTVISMWRATLADVDFDVIREHGNFVAYFLFLGFSVLGTLIMMNLLIAMMTTTFNDIREDSDTQFLLERGQTLYLVLPRDPDMNLSQGMLARVLPEHVRIPDPFDLNLHAIPPFKENPIVKKLEKMHPTFWDLQEIHQQTEGEWLMRKFVQHVHRRFRWSFYKPEYHLARYWRAIITEADQSLNEDQVNSWKGQQLLNNLRETELNQRYLRVFFLWLDFQEVTQDARRFDVLYIFLTNYGGGLSFGQLLSLFNASKQTTDDTTTAGKRGDLATLFRQLFFSISPDEDGVNARYPGTRRYQDWCVHTTVQSSRQNHIVKNSEEFTASISLQKRLYELSDTSRVDNLLNTLTLSTDKMSKMRNILRGITRRKVLVAGPP